MNNKKINKSAFTMVEVLTTSVISTIILLFLYVFLNHILTNIRESENMVKWYNDAYQIISKINKNRDKYLTWSILVDNTDWSDIYLMTNLTNTEWILFWIVWLKDNKINIDSSIYMDNGFWFRTLSETEIINISNDPSLLNDLVFQEDQILKEIKMIDLQFEHYNDNKIIEAKLIINNNFNINLINNLYEEIPKTDIQEIIINF